MQLKEGKFDFQVEQLIQDCENVTEPTLLDPPGTVNTG